MKWIDGFLNVFGEITVYQIVQIIISCLFLCYIYKQVKKYFEGKIAEQNARAEAERLRDTQIKEALDAVHKYPQYRQQSIEIQKMLESQISELKKLNEDTNARLTKMEEDITRRDRSKIRDTLLQNHRYYTNPETNPSRTWTKVEAETFWELFKEYESSGGNGHMHSDVKPDMLLLTVVDKK